MSKRWQRVCWTTVAFAAVLGLNADLVGGLYWNMICMPNVPCTDLQTLCPAASCYTCDGEQSICYCVCYKDWFCNTPSAGVPCGRLLLGACAEGGKCVGQNPWGQCIVETCYP